MSKTSRKAPRARAEGSTDTAPVVSPPAVGVTPSPELGQPAGGEPLGTSTEQRAQNARELIEHVTKVQRERNLGPLTFMERIIITEAAHAKIPTLPLGQGEPGGVIDNAVVAAVEALLESRRRSP